MFHEFPVLTKHWDCVHNPGDVNGLCRNGVYLVNIPVIFLATKKLCCLYLDGIMCILS